MQKISRTIFMSVMLHSVLLAAVVVIGNSSLQQPKRLLLVSLLEEWQKSGAAPPPVRTSSPEITRIPPAAPAVRPIQDTPRDKDRLERTPSTAAGEVPQTVTDRGIPPDTGVAAGSAPGLVQPQHGQGAEAVASGRGTPAAGASMSSGLSARETASGTGIKPAGAREYATAELDPALARKIRENLQANLVYPYLARKKRIEGTVLAEFRVNNTGMPENMRIVRTSNYAILDEAAKETIQKAAPFPAQNKRVEIPITFRMSD